MRSRFSRLPVDYWEVVAALGRALQPTGLSDDPFEAVVAELTAALPDFNWAEHIRPSK